MKLCGQCGFQRNGPLCSETATHRCEWFAGCGNDAMTTRPHPILGSVKICDRCEAKVSQLEAAVR